MENFLGRGHSPLLRHTPAGGDSSPAPTSLGAYMAPRPLRLWRSTLASPFQNPKYATACKYGLQMHFTKAKAQVCTRIAPLDVCGSSDMHFGRCSEHKLMIWLAPRT